MDPCTNFSTYFHTRFAHTEMSLKRSESRAGYNLVALLIGSLLHDLGRQKRTNKVDRVKSLRVLGLSRQDRGVIGASGGNPSRATRLLLEVLLLLRSFGRWV